MDKIANSIWIFFSGLPLIPSSKGVAEAWLSRAELSLVVFALIIGIGLVAEDRAERKEVKWIPPHPGWNWKRIFAWVVAIGVIAELFSDAAIWVSSDALQTISDGEIEKLRGDNSNLEANVQKLRAIASWREFNTASHDKLGAFIKTLPRSLKSVIILESVVGNAEAQNFGNLLAKALSDATGQTIEGPRGLSTCLQCAGVWVCTNANAVPETVEDGHAVRNALEQAGVAGSKFCTDPKNEQGSPSTVKVLVGPKES